MDVIIDVKNIIKKYYEENNENSYEVSALNGVSFQIRKGEFLSIMGPSGSGKSTLLKMLGAIEQVTSGEVCFIDKQLKKINLSELDRNELSDIRRTKIGFIFQDFQLINSLRVQDNIVIPLILNKEHWREAYKKSSTLIKTLGIENIATKYPYTLSGGQKQRVAIARALVNSPDIILADEPTGSLDSENGEIVIGLLKKVNMEMDKTIVMVTHDAKIASHSDRVLLFKDGLLQGELVKGEAEKREEFYTRIIEKS